MPRQVIREMTIPHWNAGDPHRPPHVAQLIALYPFIDAAVGNHQKRRDLGEDWRVFEVAVLPVILLDKSQADTEGWKPQAASSIRAQLRAASIRPGMTVSWRPTV